MEWKGVADFVWILSRWQRNPIRIESWWSRLVRIEWKTIPDLQWLTSLLPSSSDVLARSPTEIQSRRSQHHWRVSSNLIFDFAFHLLFIFLKVRTMEFAWTRRRSLRFRHGKRWLFTLFGLERLSTNGPRRGFVCNFQAWALHLCWMGLWRITQVMHKTFDFHFISTKSWKRKPPNDVSSDYSQMLTKH